MVHASVEEGVVQERWSIHWEGRFEPVREREMDSPDVHSPAEAVGYVDTRLIHHAEYWYHAADDEF